MTRNFGSGARLLSLCLAMGITTVACARMVKDARGNVGYEGVVECDAAVEAGTTTFYSPLNRKPPQLRPGEASVKAMTLSDVVIPLSVVDLKGFRSVRYELGACDMGSAGIGGRDGVSLELQGKYVPYSPSLPVNVYFDAAGRPVRVTMQPSDGVFSGNFPRPLPGRVVVPPAPAPWVPPPRVWASALPQATPPTPASAPAAVPATTVSPPVATSVSVKAATAQAVGSVDSRNLLFGSAVAIGLGLLVASEGDTGTTGTSGTTGTR